MGAQLPAIEVEADQKVVALAAAGDHTCALLDDARLKCWGANGSGELGLGDTVDRWDTSHQPISLGVSALVRSVASGAFHTCVVLQDDRVKCWGLGMQGALGLEDTQTRGDENDEMGDNLPALVFGKPVKALFAGGFHGCVALIDGTLRCWGENATGQLGLGDMERRGDDVGEMGASLPEVRPY
jgi:alpha-tubulin suppressor-like RCC1 family protein